MSALCLCVSGLIVATPLQGGGENFRLALLAICHPPEQNAETASDLKILESINICVSPFYQVLKGRFQVKIF